MKAISCATEKLQNIVPYSGWESFKNPLLHNEESEYLSYEHIDQLRNESAIVDWEDLGTEVIEGIGELRRMGIVTEKGYAYSTLIGIPEKQLSTVPIIGTSAWFTSTEGHNEHTVRNMMRAGNIVLFVGAEGSYEPASKPAPKGPISLADSASTVLNFSYHLGKELEEEGIDINTEKRIVIGESRGAMVGMGITALAKEFGQEVILSDLTAPCLPRPMHLKDIKDLAGQLREEPKELIKLAGRLTLARLVHYPSTLDLSPYSLRHQIAIGFALFSGEAGALARKIPSDALMHITVFNKDFASMENEWKAIFTNHSNVRITPLSGSHLTLADPETLQFILSRNIAAQLNLVRGDPFTQSNVFDAAHLFSRKSPISLKLVA